MSVENDSFIASLFRDAQRQTHQLPVFAREFIAGGIAGGCAKTAAAPLERLKILWQTEDPKYRGLGVAGSLSKIVRTEGLLGLYRGNSASVIRIVPYAAVHFMAYEQYRDILVASGLQDTPRLDLLAGSVAGCSAVVLTYPLDLVRTRLAVQPAPQASSWEPHLPSGTITADQLRRQCPQAVPQYRGVADALGGVGRREGFFGLYRGVGPTLLGVLPYSGLKFFIYEFLKLHFSDKSRPSVAQNMFFGIWAGLVGQTATYPLDVVRRRMQVQGLNMPGNPLSNPLCSPCAAAGSTCQLDALARLGTSGSDAARSGMAWAGARGSAMTAGTAPIQGIWQGMYMIAKTEGIRQLYRGLTLNYMKAVPAVGAGFAVYDYVKGVLGIAGHRTRGLSTG
eukprot:jgi/Mesvir1/12191/Mv00428-RA.1